MLQIVAAEAETTLLRTYDAGVNTGLLKLVSE